MTNTTLSPSALPDTELFELCLAGRREAFGELVTRYQWLICAQAYSVCGDFGCSEDVAQETFVSAWKQLAQLRDRTRFKPWLCGIARHLALRVARRQSGPVDADGMPLKPAAELIDPGPRPDENAASREEAALV